MAIPFGWLLGRPPATVPKARDIRLPVFQAQGDRHLFQFGQQEEDYGEAEGVSRAANQEQRGGNAQKDCGESCRPRMVAGEAAEFAKTQQDREEKAAQAEEDKDLLPPDKRRPKQPRPDRCGKIGGKVAPTVELGAQLSSWAPNSETWFRRRARKPSRASLTRERRKRKRKGPGRSVAAATRSRGARRIRRMLKRLGMVSALLGK